VDGGYAEYAVADERFCFCLPERYGDLAASPLLCEGVAGYRALAMTGDAERVGLYGFGAGAIVAARISRLVFGARDLRFGGVRSKFRIADSEVLNHSVQIVEGVLAPEAVELLRQFFEGRR